MPDEIPEQPASPGKLSNGQASFFAGVVIALLVLLFISLLFMLGLLIYAAFSLSSSALIDSLFCLLASLLIIGWLGLLFKMAGASRRNLPAALATGRETYIKVKEELSRHYERAKDGEY